MGNNNCERSSVAPIIIRPVRLRGLYLFTFQRQGLQVFQNLCITRSVVLPRQRGSTALPEQL